VEASGCRIDVDAVVARLSERFPIYMVPSAFAVIEEIPHTASGKVDRKRLPEPRPRERGAITAPRTDTELMVAELWQQVLEQPAIDIDDDFFAIGGHSLLATKVISRLRRLLDADIPLSLLFDNPTITRMAHALEAWLEVNEPESVSATEPITGGAKA
jgi:hypothetical protein